MEDYLRRLYTDPALPSSLGGVDALYRRVKEDGKYQLNRKDIKQWLRAQRTYTLHKPVRKKYPRHPTVTSDPDRQWQSDLIDMSEFASQNGGRKFILTTLDVFSRYGWVRSVKNKSGAEIAQAFESILTESGRRPDKLQTDAGREFRNARFRDVLRRWDIELFHTNSEMKAALVERFNRSLKSRIWRYFTAYGTRKYWDVLQALCKSYNHSYHRSIGMKPAEVTGDRIQEVKERFSDLTKGTSQTKPLFSPGQTVRISRQRMHFEKGYLPGWSHELFTIVRRNSGIPYSYQLQDYNKEALEGAFYEPELQAVAVPSSFPIERIIRTRRVKGRTQYFVKWLGYSDKFNSWVDEVTGI